MVDIQKALLDPTSVFSSPQDILEQPELSREQKIEILRRWAYDVKELQTADDENMTSTRRSSDTLDEIVKALKQLGAGLLSG